MQEQQSDIQVHFQGRNLIYSQIASFIVFFFPPLAGAFYVAGSFVYWPSFSNINPATGGILFTIGSVLLLLTDFAATYLEPYFSMFKPLNNVGSFKSFCSLVGNVSYTIGSIYFIPNLPVTIGEHLFIIGSIFQFIPQILSVWGVCSLNFFTAQYYTKMVAFKKTVVYINVCSAIGCFCFFIGTQLFMYQNIESKGLFQEAVILFIIGSIFFVIGPLLALNMRKIRILDPLAKYHEQMHTHFLPKEPFSYFVSKKQEKGDKNILIIQKNPSIIVDTLQNQTQ